MVCEVPNGVGTVPVRVEAKRRTRDGTAASGGIRRNTTDPASHRRSSRARTCSLEVADGRVASFRCHGATIWPTYVASIFKPDLAISLRPA